MENLIHNKRISTVVPAKMTKEDKKIHQLTNMDLAMKLHYLRGVYFFKSEAVQSLVIFDLKKPFFELLNVFFPAAGRVRLAEDDGGRPYIKCNDSGVRIIEAQSSKTLVEWMDMIQDDLSLNDELTHNHVLGPDLHFSPLVFVQFTWFKCGGMSVGLSWSHILGDALTASTFINMWAQILEDQMPRQPPKNSPNSESNNYKLPPLPRKSFPLKSVDPVGDYWISPNNYKMKTHSFLVSPKQLNHICGLGPILNIDTRPFEYLSAILWKCIAKIRKEFMAASVVTICRNKCLGTGNAWAGNRQIVSTVEYDSSVVDADVAHLADFVANKTVDEGETIKYLIDQEHEMKSDFIMYGANLTFVNLEEAKLQEMELKGVKAVYSNYVVDGVGENGVVLVLPELNDGGGGRRVTMVMPENEVEQLKHQLKYEWGII